MMKDVNKYTFIFDCGSKQMVMSNRTTSGIKIRNRYWGENGRPDSLVVQSRSNHKQGGSEFDPQ